MNLLYYIILSFGGLLFLYTAISWSTTSKKINAKEYRKNGIKTLIEELNKKVSLWFFYFVDGDKQKLIRNVLISFIIFIFCFYINIFYIKIDRLLFCLLFFTFFIFSVWYLGQRRNKKMFTEIFPDVIQILNSAITSGAGLLQALDRCGKDLPGSLGNEFRNIHRRLAIGEDPVAVFDDSYIRYPYKEFYYFIIIIRTNLSRGGQIREVITRLGRLIVDTKKMEKKKKAMTSEARISALIVACFPIGFFIFMQFFMPENFDFLINNSSGRLVLYYVFGSELLGMIIIWWLMRRAT
ncbi:type II secretion system F family protein [Rodentibacter caecimuris]|uniref:Protein dehydratase n=1 Tax=Rodentibacter caecimuris TaxID=1796644 RepID=A0ABX3KX59_9PAST|nr:protein dehydratase [Rodentibacter heylii]